MPIRCIVGLGNPGSRYEGTRHNAGFWVVDRIATGAGLTWLRLEDAYEAMGRLEDRQVILLKPQTYVNRSGQAVLRCLERHLLTPGELLVVVDDVDLPVSRLRLRPSGGAGGHRGLESIEETIASRGYPRLRIGVGRAEEGEDLADFLLRPLDEDERCRFASIVERGAEAAREAVRGDLASAMNRFNPPPAETSNEERGSASQAE
jgi:PTH1 family peptidyl-tRNA hydrolase